MTKEEALKLKHGNRVKYTQTGAVFEFLGFETKDLEPPLGDGPTVFAKLLDENGWIGFIQLRDIGPFELVKDS